MIFSYLLVLFIGADSIPKAASTTAFRESMFNRCPKGLTQTNYRPLKQVTGHSHLECVVKCSGLAGCEGVNVCPGEVEGQVSCALTGEVSAGPCYGLTVGSASSLCYHVQRHHDASPMTTQPDETPTQGPTTTELACQNGGTPNGDRCDCSVQFGGKTCDRYIRDCTEPFLRGHTSDEMGQFLIHPQGAPAPFMVRCRFNNDGITYPLRRFNEEGFCQDLATCKGHSGDNLETDPNPRNFFIGLENIHYLLAQATYDLHVSMMFADGGSGSVIYTNFNIGPDSTNFQITFDEYDPTSYADRGFSTALPVMFSAAGYDVNGCFQARGVAGWYGSDCSGSSMFADMGQLLWPVGGSERQVEQLDFLVIRRSPLDYDDLSGLGWE